MPYNKIIKATKKGKTSDFKSKSSTLKTDKNNLKHMGYKIESISTSSSGGNVPKGQISIAPGCLIATINILLFLLFIFELIF